MAIHLYFGTDAYSLNRAAARLRRDGGFEDADILRFEGAGLDWQELIMAAATSGFFSSQRLVIVRHLTNRLGGGRRAGRAKTAGGATPSLAALAAAIADTTTLLVLEPGTRKDSALVKEAQQLAKDRPEAIFVREFTAPRRRDLPRWLMDRAQELGARLEPQAAETLAVRVGEQPIIAGAEMAKLADAAQPEGRITRALVEELVVQSAEEMIFPLVDAVATGRGDAALQLLQRQTAHVGKGKDVELALQVIRMLGRQFRLLLQIRLLTADGMSRAVIIDRLKLSPYFSGNYFNQARRLTPDRLSVALERLAQLEFAIKNGDAMPGSLELLVIDLSGMVVSTPGPAPQR